LRQPGAISHPASPVKILPVALAAALLICTAAVASATPRIMVVAGKVIQFNSEQEARDALAVAQAAFPGTQLRIREVGDLANLSGDEKPLPVCRHGEHPRENATCQVATTPGLELELQPSGQKKN
jgi:hypothetical protein